MRLLHEIAIFQTVKSKVIISLFETVRLSVSVSPRNLYNSLNSIKETSILHFLFNLPYSLYFNFQHATEAFRKTYTGQNKTANISASVWKIH